MFQNKVNHLGAVSLEYKMYIFKKMTYTLKEDYSTTPVIEKIVIGPYHAGAPPLTPWIQS